LINFNDHLIPVESGNAVSRWTNAYPRPMGVTWHWTATWDLATCRKILGGSDPLRKGKASAHYGVGRTRSEGIDRYVTLENRSWHAGAGQTLTWEGKPSDSTSSGARTTVGIETVNIGYERSGVPAKDDWTVWATPDCRQELAIPPWPDEQIEMMVELGVYILGRCPDIGPLDHHGHADICPGRKFDVMGFPWMRVLEGIHGDDCTFDVWTPYRTIKQRQQALIDLGYDLGSWGADGAWGRVSSTALEQFHEDNDMVTDPYWTVFTARAAYRTLKTQGA